MLFTEWNWDDALAVREEEGREEGREETVKNLLDFGMKPEQISRALKLSFDAVQRYLDGP
jgi:predicted transposase YdaD